MSECLIGLRPYISNADCLLTGYAVLQVVGGLFMTGIVGLAIWTFVGIWRHED